jgi:hypothetical protein
MSLLPLNDDDTALPEDDFDAYKECPKCGSKDGDVIACDSREYRDSIHDRQMFRVRIHMLCACGRSNVYRMAWRKVEAMRML